MKKLTLLLTSFIPTLLFGQMTINTVFTNHATCFGLCNGETQIQATGGIAPITFAITNGSGSETINQLNDSTWSVTNMCAGSWDMQVIDAIPDTASTSIVINEPTDIIISSSVTDVSCFGICDGTAQEMPTGGTTPYSFLWDANTGNQTTSFAINLCAGTYTVLIIDANGCTANSGATIQEPMPIQANATITQPSCSPGCDGIVDVSNVTGGAGFYTFSFNPGGFIPPYSGLCTGSYVLQITDANGCFFDSTFTLGSTINTANTITEPTCGLSDGAISTSPTSGTSPWAFAWTGPNGFTSNSQNISNIPSGTYNVSVTDALGCNGTTTIIVNNIPNSGITATLTSQDATCGDGSSTVNITSGTAPFSATWSNGDTNVTTNNLNAGSYSVYIEDVNGCNNTIPITIADLGGGNCGNISGSVFSDANSNCTFDGSDVYIGGRIVTVNPGNFIATTDANGYYEFNIPFGSYNVNRTAANGYTMLCNNTGLNVTTSIGTPSISNVDFGDSLNLVADAIVSVYGQNVRPQLSTTHYIYLLNPTSTDISGELYYVMDSSMTYSSANPAPDVINGDTLMWNIAPFTTSNYYSVPYYIYGFGPNAPVGSTVQQCAWFTSVQTETTLSNNTYCYDQTVTGSWDPNDKSVLPEGGIRTKDSTLEYLIRFQNTGTDTAFTVVITDTMSALLDLASLEVLASSHEMTYQIINNNVLEFTFNDILLPDSNVNEQGSHGSVMYAIHQNTSNVIGDTIENTANIYFDFNAPVITNTTISPIVPKQFAVTSSGIDVSCFGDCNGNVSVTPTGDEPPFLILWNDANASTTNSVDSLCFGTYTAIVIDAEGDTITHSVDVLEPNAMTVSSTAVDDINNMCQGQASVSPSGGSGTYTYLWDVAAGSQTTATATGLCGANYNVTITDSQGCSITETVAVLNSLGISENELTVLVAPNPFENEFTLKLNGEIENIVIINILGEVIRNIQTTENKVLMDLSKQNSGIYFIQIQNKGEVLKTLKVVKN